MTVSLALRNAVNISDAKKKQIWDVANELGYQPDPLKSRVMSALRYKHRECRAIALVGMWSDIDPLIKGDQARVLNGLVRSAESTGYVVQRFCFDDVNTTGKQLSRILRTRGIRAAVLAGSIFDKNLSLDLTALSVVVLGSRAEGLRVNRVGYNDARTLMQAIQKLRYFGNRRIGVLIPAGSDSRSDCNWSSGYHRAMRDIPEEERVPMLLLREPEADLFMRWFERYKPDAIVSLVDPVATWLGGMNVRVPDDVHLVTLNYSQIEPQTAGMNQNHEELGSAGCELLLSQVYLNQFGPPPAPRSLLIEGAWVDGPTATPRL